MIGELKAQLVYQGLPYYVKPGVAKNRSALLFDDRSNLATASGRNRDTLDLGLDDMENSRCSTVRGRSPDIDCTASNSIAFKSFHSDLEKACECEAQKSVCQKQRTR